MKKTVFFWRKMEYVPPQKTAKHNVLTQKKIKDPLNLILWVYITIYTRKFSPPREAKIGRKRGGGKLSGSFPPLGTRP